MIHLVRYWLPVVAVAASICYASSLPPLHLPPSVVPYQDKFLHFLAYTSLAFMFARAQTNSLRMSPYLIVWRRVIASSFCVVALFGVTDEFHQSFVPGREVELWDLVADLCGALCGSLLVYPYRLWIYRVRALKCQAEPSSHADH